MISLVLVTSADEISRQISTGKLDIRLIVHMLQQHKAHLERAFLIRATDKQGNIIYGADSLDLRPNVADREYFIKLRNTPDAGLVISKPVIGKTNQEWSWIFAQRINGAHGSFNGVVLVSVPISEISKLFAQIGVGPGVSIALRDAEQRLVARHPVVDIKDFSNREQQHSQQMLETLRNNPEQGAFTSTSAGSDGDSRMFSYYRHPKYGFLVNVGVSEKTALAGWHHQLGIICGLAAAFIIAILAFMALVVRTWRRQDAALSLLQETQHIAQLGQYTYDVRTGLWASSDIFNEIFGIGNQYPRSRESWSALVAPEHRDERLIYLDAVVENRRLFDREYSIIRPTDGEKRWIHSRGKLQLDDDGAPTVLVGTIQDITIRKQIESDLRIAATAFQSQDAMVITDASNVIMRVNNSFTQTTGYTLDEVIGQTPRVLKSGRHNDEFFRNMWDSITQTGGWQGEIWDKRKNGEEYQKWLTISVVKDSNGIVTNYIGAQYDITERKLAEAKIHALAFYDQLSGLPNRTLLIDRLRQATRASARSGNFGALLLIDLDNFKLLNDSHGHDMGDLLLQQVAKRLTECVREEDTVARLGGDEFVVMLTNLSSDELDAISKTERVAYKILSELSQTYQLGSTVHHNTPSIGVNLFCGNKVENDILLKQVDLAMYRAKDSGRNAIRFFDPAMEKLATHRAELENDLREAILNNQFFLHYQPQIATEKLVGAEVLMRWRHPRRGMVPPDEFIPLAEHTGLILPLGTWALERACNCLVAWAERPDMAHLTLAVNVSASQFRHKDFIDEVLNIIAKTGANPERLKLELTESMLVSNIEELAEKMHALKRMGVSLSLDDFGTGYSSLSLLKRLPLDQLKIDRSFIKDIPNAAQDASVVVSIITLGEGLSLEIIAEGVEYATQKDYLASIGCHTYQGYLFSKPLPLDEFEEYAAQLTIFHRQQTNQ